MKTRSATFLAASWALLLVSCRRDMQDQPKYKPLAENKFFVDGRDSRPIPPGTVAVDEGDAADSAHTGADNGAFLTALPIHVDSHVLHRGQDRFNIYCSPCHGRLGDGDGMVHRRGFWIPPTLHTDRLRTVPPGYLYQVISNGYGAMPDYRDQIEVADRWAIVAYVRALQYSRHASLADVPESARTSLDQQGAKQ